MIKIRCLVLFFLVYSGTVSAQEKYGSGGDDQILNFGFSFQYISSDYKILKKANWRDPYLDPESNAYVTDSLSSISSSPSQGFGLGFVTDVKLSDHANLRLTPSLSFADRDLDYHYTDPSKNKQQIVPATMVDLPLAIKIKSDRRTNFRAYMIGGARYSIDIISQKKLDDSGKIAVEKSLKNVRNILSYEAGIGFELYFEWFIMRPEIKLSNSFRSVLKPEANPYSSPVDKLFLHNLQLSIYFE
jgi:hypothetical protein